MTWIKEKPLPDDHSTLYAPDLSQAERDVLDQAVATVDATTALLNKHDFFQQKALPSAQLLYACMPTLLSEIVKKYPGTEQDQSMRAVSHIAKILVGFARVCQQLRIRYAQSKQQDVRVLNEQVFRELAVNNPDAFLSQKLSIEANHDTLELMVSEPVKINEHSFPKRESLSQVAGESSIWIGSGGGSDSIQAIQMALETPGSLGVISIRSNILGSETSKPEKRTVENAQEVYPGVFLINPESSGSGRFLENSAALAPGEMADGRRLPLVLIVVDDKELLPDQLRQAITWIENLAIQAGIATTAALNSKPPTLMNVDTGGDCWRVPEPEGMENKAVATADQDFMMLECLAGMIEYVTKSVTICNGVDSPDTVMELMAQAGVEYFEPDQDMAKRIWHRYKMWDLVGANEKRYGKTAFTWQRALILMRQALENEDVFDQEMQSRFVAVPLPERAILHPSNPWDPYVCMQSAMRGMFIADLRRHYQTLLENA